jgi:alginate O-acetyltransferase complex protein AlgI
VANGREFDLLFNSYGFLFVFLPVALTGFFGAARFGRPVAGLWLIVCSFVFYGWWNPAFCFVLAASILFNYTISLLLARARSRPELCHMILAGGIALNLAALVYFKYLAWLVGLLDEAFAAGFAVPNIVLPLGISFFTFTQIGYLADCVSGAARNRDPLNYVLFVTFFPHLIAGPILHNQDIMPQFALPATYRWSAKNVAVGSGIFVLGLLKKSVLADHAGIGVAESFAHPDNLPVFAAWQATLCYSLQLYFDFSGYSDMAIGIGRMFNITLPLNFNSPYKAASIIDYWQRWHMSLTRYLTQYVYTPFALLLVRRRSARGLPINRPAQQTAQGFCEMVALPILVTMTLAGIWHGSGAQFLVFGLLHGAYLCVNRVWRLRFGGPDTATSRPWQRVTNVLLTYLCVLVASVFFRAPSVADALSMLGGMAGLHGTGLTAIVNIGLSNGAIGTTPGAPAADLATLISASGSVLQALAGPEWFGAMYLIVWGMPNTQQIFADLAPTLDRVPPLVLARLRFGFGVPWAVAIGSGLVLGVLSIGGSSEFLYFQF